jgi:uncharacterized protein (DUF1919 family)
MEGYLQKITKKISSYCFHLDMKTKVKNSHFTIVSDNDWGKKVYDDLGMEYNSPFIGMFIFAPDYIELLSNFEHYMKSPLKFTLHSKYDGISGVYPIGLLDQKVEIHFYSYKYKQTVLNDWNERIKRINWDQLFFKFSDQYQCRKECIETFNQLPLKNKVCFTARPMGHLDSVVYFSNQHIETKLENELTDYKKYFDVVSWLNTGEVIKKEPKKRTANFELHFPFKLIGNK